MANFIIESPIYQEAQNVKVNANKALFRMIVQTVDEENQNHRIYPKNILFEGLKSCSKKIKTKSFMGELDHPIPTGNDTFDGIRQTQVLLDSVSHYINGYEFSGKKIIADLETATTDKGKTLLCLLKDRAGIGMSLRAMADVERDQRRGVQIVKSPIHIVAYDAVSSPSHSSAVVNFNEMTFESKMICEQTSGLICLNGKCFTANYFDKLIETKQIQFFKNWI